jgi:hypothetical protein
VSLASGSLEMAGTRRIISGGTDDVFSGTDGEHSLHQPDTDQDVALGVVACFPPNSFTIDSSWGSLSRSNVRWLVTISDRKAKPHAPI